MADFTLKHSGEKINELLDKAGTALQEHQDISGKQDTLVSGKSIKTINGESLLGEGDIAVISSTPNCESPEGTEGYIRNKTHYTEVISELPAFHIQSGGTILLSGITPNTFIEFRNWGINTEDICISDAYKGTTVSFPVNGPDMEAIWTESEDGTLSLVQTTETNYDILNVIHPYVVYFKQLPSAYLSVDIARSSQVNEVGSKVDSILGEDGYLYSNGEKIDMRFTRSLLPIGTSIPAKANLNTKEYLKIGKYYCSLNNDAKTITNCPVNVAFSMEVFNPLGTNVDDEDTREYTYRMRVLTQYDTGQQYMQFCRTSGTPGSWTYDSWYITARAKFTLASSKNDGSAAVGSATQGAYVDSTGTLTKMTYTLAKSVPSNAVFTDTKVTAVANHYSPAEDESAVLNAAEGEVVTGIKRDAAGHVVGLVSSPYSRGEGSSAYIASFTVEDLNRSFSSQEFIDLADRDELLAAISSNRMVLVPHASSGYGIMIPDLYTTMVSVITASGDVYGFDIGGHDFVVDPELSTNIFDKQDKIDDLAAIRDGASKGASALQEIPEGYATESYVSDAIAAAITNVLNTPV